MQKVEDIIKIVSTPPEEEIPIDIKKERKALGIKLSLELFQLIICILVLLTLFVAREFIPYLFSDAKDIYNEYIIEDAFVDESEIIIVNEE